MFYSNVMIVKIHQKKLQQKKLKIAYAISAKNTFVISALSIMQKVSALYKTI